MISTFEVDSKITEKLKELTFEYENNMMLYEEDKKSIDQTLDYNDKEDEWTEITKKILYIQMALNRMSKSYLHEFISSGIFGKSKEQRAYAFLKSTAYGDASCQYARQIGHCIESKKIEPLDVRISLSFHDVTRFLAQMQICGWWDKADELGTDILQSISDYDFDVYQANITYNGERVYPISWFIVDLYSLFGNSWYVENNANHPSKKEYKLWQDVLDRWDTTDLLEVEKMVFTLCELHIIELDRKNIVEENMDNILGGSMEHAIDVITNLVNKRSSDEFIPRELNDMSVHLFPYEVFALLSIREKMGFKNPRTFLHPLMNTAITKGFKIDDNTIPSLKSVDYILENTRNFCPDIEIVQEKGDSTINNKDILPGDFLVN